MPTGDSVSVRHVPAAMVAIALAIALAVPAGAAVKPGDVITAQTAYKVKDLVSPGVYYKVTRGMSMDIVPTSTIQWPPPFRDATEKYADQVRLSPDGRSLVNYVAGQPFPFLDPNDPSVATKIMWNAAFRPITSDDYDLRYYDCDDVYEGLNKPYNVIDYFQIGHYAGYDEVGRTEVDPIPIDPDFKTTGRYWMFALYPILTPENLRGSGFIRYRYANPTKADDIWQWTPGTRRLRRLNEGIMSDAAVERRQSDFVRSRSLFGLQRQGRRIQLQAPWPEDDAGFGEREAFAGNHLLNRRRRQRVSRELGDAPTLHRSNLAARLGKQPGAALKVDSLHRRRDVVRALRG